MLMITLKYKLIFPRLGWFYLDLAKKNLDNSPINNKLRYFMRRKVVLILLLFISLISGICQLHAQANDNIIIGRIRNHDSKILNEQRRLFIYLPPSYNLTQGKYPVLYLLDGDWHFNYVAGLVEFLARNNKIPEMIVVGVANTVRNHDFTPIKTESVSGSGGADNFLRYMKDELVPFIDSNYRTEPYRILAGHSLCGMFSIYSLLNEPDLFNSYIAMSPWVISQDKFIVNYTAENIKKFKSLKKQIYFTAGSLEEKELLSTLDVFIKIMKNDAPDDLKWKFKLFEGEDHGTLVLPAMNDGLLNIYDGWRLPEGGVFNRIEAIIEHYKSLSKKFGYTIAVPEVTINQLGYTYLLQQNFEKAIETFKKNVELYPESPNVYDSLGEAYERHGEIKEAAKSYESADKIAEKTNHPNKLIFKNNYERAKELLNKKN